MTADSVKLDDILAKMDVLITAKTEMLNKLDKLEKAQSTINKDVEDLKKSFQETDLQIQESKSNLLLKADKTEVEVLKEKIDDLENRSKRNNVVIWGIQEGSEKDYTSMEEFIENDTPKPRPIQVYLLRYTDKVFLLKQAASKLKDNKYKEAGIFISDDVSKTVRDERSKLRKDFLPNIKAKPGVQFAFIPWSVPAKILYKEESTGNLKSFYLPKV
ncbi:hypothetical protein ACROYT_G014250 [Oculina patagonica]